MREFLNMRIFIFVFTFIFLALNSCNNNGANNSKPNVSNNANGNASRKQTAAPVYGYQIVNTYPHDSKAFTQGLIFHDGFLYESTGEYKESTLRKVNLSTGKVEQKFDLAPEYFAEGMTFLNDKLYQVTWRESTAFAYDPKTFQMLQEFDYPGQGWGLTNDGTHLIMSDGTHVLRFMDPATFKTEKTLPVFREDGQPLMNINELEYVRGEIWANIWHSEIPDVLGKPNRIARIDPSSGNIVGWLDLTNISPDDARRDSENTLNGIAYDSSADRIFVTGKNWKKLFEIKVISPQPAQ